MARETYFYSGVANRIVHTKVNDSMEPFGVVYPVGYFNGSVISAKEPHEVLQDIVNKIARDHGLDPKLLQIQTFNKL